MIVVTGLSHHTATIEVRERVALTDEGATQLASELSESAHVAEVFVVSTCNRVEIIAKSRSNDEESARLCADLCRTALLRRAPDAQDAVYTRFGVDAVRHVFRVAASLDSLVVGEAQILGQLKQGYESGKRGQTVGSHLHQLFVRASRTAKRVRTETTIGSGQVSVPSIAIELAGQIFGDLSKRKAVLIGTGEMGQTVARLLRDAGAELLVIGRKKERALPIAEEMGARFGLPDTIGDALREADVVVSSTSATSPVVRLEHLEPRRRARRRGNLFFIDLAVPRDVEPRVGDLDGVFLYDVDDLAHVAAESAGSRHKAAREAERIIDHCMADWGRRVSAQAVTPTIKALRAKLRRGLEEELAKSLRGRLRHLDDEQRTALAKMLDAGLNRILHEPLTRLREEAVREDGPSVEDLAAFVTDLFDLRGVPQDDLDVSSVRLPETTSKVSFLSAPGEESAPDEPGEPGEPGEPKSQQTPRAEATPQAQSTPKAQ